MRTLLGVLLLCKLLVAQTEASPPSLAPVRFDARNGWPKVLVPSQRPTFLDAGRKPVLTVPQQAMVPTPAPLGETRRLTKTAENTALPSVWLTVREPAAFAALQGRSMHWRVTVHGSQGEALGNCEVTHVLDCRVPARDRLEFADGRIFGRDAATSFALRSGMPWPTLQDAAERELATWGMLARAPWCFADRQQYFPLASEPTANTTLQLRFGKLAGTHALGPTEAPSHQAQFTLCSEPGLAPHLLRYSLVEGQAERTVQWSDWREVDGANLPFRRVFVDRDGRAQLTCELLSVQACPVPETLFRLGS